MEYGKDMLDSGFIPIAWWIANAWDPCEDVRVRALDNLHAKHMDNVHNLKREGQFDESAEIELWHPCVTFSFPLGEDGLVKQLEQQGSERARRDLQVRNANCGAWRIWHGFGKGPWTRSRKATPKDLATQSRWVQLNWPIHRSHGALCPKNCLCSICMDNEGLTDTRVAILRRRSNPRTTNEELRATMSALKDFRSYCTDIHRNIQQRINMDVSTRSEIEMRLDTEQAWIRSDRVKLFADKDDIEQRKNEFASFIERIGSPPARETELDKLKAKHRRRLQHCFKYNKLVKVTDPDTGKGAIARIDYAVKSERLGAGDDPDWVYIKGTWYRDSEVDVNNTQEVIDCQSSGIDASSEASSLVDDIDYEVADVEAENVKVSPREIHSTWVARSAQLLTNDNSATNRDC